MRPVDARGGADDAWPFIDPSVPAKKRPVVTSPVAASPVAASPVVASPVAASPAPAAPPRPGTPAPVRFESLQSLYPAASNPVTQPYQVTWSVMVATALAIAVVWVWLRVFGGVAPSTVAVDPVREGASMRLAMAITSNRIEDFRRTYGRAPSSLVELGPEAWDVIRYERVADDHYRLIGATSRGPIVFDSMQSLDSFVGPSHQLVAGPRPR